MLRFKQQQRELHVGVLYSFYSSIVVQHGNLLTQPPLDRKIVKIRIQINRLSILIWL